MWLFVFPCLFHPPPVLDIFDKFIPCLKDSNSKVNVQALQVMSQLTRPLCEYMNNVINLTVPTVSSNLSSKNKDILQAATTVLDSFIEYLDGSLLLQPFANQVQSGNQRIKPDMIDRVAFLVTKVYSRKPKAIHLHVLPLLWHLLGGSTGTGAASLATSNMRSATAKLVQSLYSLMGPGLLEAASATSTVTPRMQESLQTLIENP
ncbi:TOG array regulator of axonemal microtubules protein 1 [Lamellibrachia satsuma]|nr:TOG array regulator of axonemal microtubules protein 1 [Lamellibrachia satsuma]